VGVVVVVHDLALAMNHADHVIVLDRGTVAANGPPHVALAEEVLSGVWGVNALGGRWPHPRACDRLIGFPHSGSVFPAHKPSCSALAALRQACVNRTNLEHRPSCRPLLPVRPVPLALR
jgi:energy-coupling factor transporter ATP-binding protein EcfA2